jgi:hypothetical protein
MAGKEYGNGTAPGGYEPIPKMHRPALKNGSHPLEAHETLKPPKGRSGVVQPLAQPLRSDKKDRE